MDLIFDEEIEYLQLVRLKPTKVLYVKETCDICKKKLCQNAHIIYHVTRDVRNGSFQKYVAFRSMELNGPGGELCDQL
jgi:hypothetical protein